MGHDPAEFDFLAEEAAEVGASPELPPVRRVEVPAPDGALSALLWGAAPELTLLHGGGLNAHTWDATILALGRPALALDLPGHGDSAWRDDFDYSPRRNARAAAEVLDAVAPGTPQTVVGQSLGAHTAIALAETRPDLVGRLVLVDASPGQRLEDAAQVTDFLAGPQVFGSREEIVEKALAAGIGSSHRALTRGVALNTRVRDDGTVVFKHHFASPPPDAGFTIDFRDLWPALETSAVPVLLVRGTYGFLSPEVVDEFRARVPRAEILEIESGHNVQEQQPAALAAAISRFLAGPTS
ncbi:alpha/beta hydrolase [Frankia sp. CNm7]|uniref:Alpha/beta hydrolase n=1 Tax=Frankia nepalensis TaxID=1836974 RepID=A0A937UNT0_9ACTN|nr:alpha/beta hydrolase [Frankia nepalensis]MBL7498632.1 alpha/beta hydrolase [Frankia nepalensis]MBL7509202.1 alpha/beta hydrolase [Frankia nepalensis]MBL7521204.1 alpha/beta hydrolase [Frankia nepalensis]MBL7628393.1 alpha/beta hydrolase [Frankia nepalensis]